ncbi:hypothetical protein BZA77DRAFT_295296 [Pyronema omphalodes]|nr:hypothetical protein BZA77DRAFT_295296 [Pyronema omphalodes]
MAKMVHYKVGRLERWIVSFMRSFQIIWNLGVLALSVSIYCWEREFRSHYKLPSMPKDNTMICLFWIISPCFISVWTIINFSLFLRGTVLPGWTLIQDCVCAVSVIVHFILVTKIMSITPKDVPDTKIDGFPVVVFADLKRGFHAVHSSHSVYHRQKDDFMGSFWILDGVNMKARNEWLKAQDNAALDRIFWQKPEFTGKLEANSSANLV